MALDTPPAPVSGFRLAPVEPRCAPLFCFALLTISCALASFVLAWRHRLRPSAWLLRRCYLCVPRCLS